MTIVRQLPRDMSALCGKADDDGPPTLLSDWCCGAMDASEDIDKQSECESKSSGTNSLKSRSTQSASAAKSTQNVRYPPIVFSPVDESRLTLVNQRSIAARSIAESTFVDDNDDDLYMALAGIMGGDEIARILGYNKEDNTSASGTTDQKYSTESSPEASATKRAPKDDDADDNTSLSSSITNPFPTWVAFSLEAYKTKLTKNENIEIKPRKNRNKLTNFLFKRNKKKSAFVASPSDTSTAASAMSSIGLCTAWGGK